MHILEVVVCDRDSLHLHTLRVYRLKRAMHSITQPAGLNVLDFIYEEWALLQSPLVPRLADVGFVHLRAR